MGAEKFDHDQSAKLTNRTSMRIFDAGGVFVRVAGNGWLGGDEQSAAVNQFLFANSIGEEAELANADESGRQHVKQKA